MKLKSIICLSTAVLTSANLTASALPPSLITRQSGKVKAEISQLKVVQNNGKEGWSAFEEISGLAEVTLRLEINRGGKINFTKTLSAMYRSGDLPREFRIIDLDGDKEPEVFVTLLSEIGSATHANLSTSIYKYQPQKSTYSETDISWENFGYEIKDLDKNGIPEFISVDNRFKESLGLCTICVSPPIRIWQYRKGQMVDVTRRYPKAIRSNAYTIWREYEQVRSNKQHAKGKLAGYLATKYLLNESEDGWRRIKQAYQESDRTSFFNDLRALLREKGYIPK
ncbi:MAG: hypothetical protein V7L11_18430 [Nostoc sp.]|uniref:hypothetical protein n=1 Tax=Nostoc sp. TaxID=1180 RepID=UPI002FF95BB0